MHWKLLNKYWKSTNSSQSPLLFLLPGTPPLPSTPPKPTAFFQFVCQSRWSLQFVADFLPSQKFMKKHILSKPHKIKKNLSMGTQWLDFDDLGWPFGYPFFIKLRNHPNLLICIMHDVKTLLLQLLASHFGIGGPLQIHVFSRRDLAPHFCFSPLYPKLRLLDPFKIQWTSKLHHKSAKRRNNISKSNQAWTFRDFGTDSLPKGRPKSHRGSFWMTCYGFWNLFCYFTWQQEQIPLNNQAPNSMQNTRRDLAKNFGKLVRTSAHLETVQSILQFPKQHQPQLTSNYKIRWRRCARRMAHRDPLRARRCPRRV